FDGFDGAVAPFMSTLKTIRAKPAYLKDVLPENNSAMPIEPQILGNNPENFVPLAKQLFDMGYNTVNWNLGCPYPMVAKKQRGSGLLPFPEKIDMFLNETVPVIPNRLSIKSRLGYKRPDEIQKLIPIFNQYPLKRIIIHPRTGNQMYAGEPDLEAFEECLNFSRHPVIYNGDITDLKTFRNLAARFDTINHWMIGRGAIANPFLPAILKAGKDTFTDKVVTFKRFYADLYAEYQGVLRGPGHLLERMKGFWAYFSQSFQNGHELRKKIHRTHIHKRYQEIVERFFEAEAEWLD
ncbi:MAG: tRNA-dihydrouridine synthase family protein, partial [Desulfobacterales bacterium]